MNPLFLTLIGISVLFFLFLTLRNFSKNLCAICLSVSFTWIVLLVMYFADYFKDKTIIAILMGMTSIGLFYLFYEKLNVFKLPFILTAISVIYFVLEKIEINAVYFLIILWTFFSGIYLFRKKPSLKSYANKIIECCRKW